MEHDKPFRMAMAKKKTDWTVILVNVGLWGMAILLTLPYIIDALT